MKFIAAVDENWGIGYKGRLLARISEDQKNFKNVTMGHVVVLGRKTLEEFPHAKPLAGRINIILSHDIHYTVDGAVVVHSIDELFHELKNYDTNDIFVIGGQSVYDKLIPYCDKAYITKIYKSYEADAFIENLDKNSNWRIEEEGENKQYNDISFNFNIYVNNNPVQV
ncbi:MAG: dihydrofolate reductase [Coprococcus sp.]